MDEAQKQSVLSVSSQVILKAAHIASILLSDQFPHSPVWGFNFAGMLQTRVDNENAPETRMLTAALARFWCAALADRVDTLREAILRYEICVDALGKEIDGRPSILVYAGHLRDV